MAVAAKPAQLLEALRVGALPTLAQSLSCLTGSPDDPTRNAARNIEALSIALGRFLDRHLGRLAIRTTQGFELSPVISGSVGVVGRILRTQQQLAVLGREAL